MSECLHCDINELVQDRIERGGSVDVPDLVRKMAERLADLIVSVVPAEQQANALAEAITLRKLLPGEDWSRRARHQSFGRQGRSQLAPAVAGPFQTRPGTRAPEGLGDA